MRSSSTLIPLSVRGYVRSRAAEIAKPTTRATSEPLADWALRRVRLDGRPFRFEGHEYLRPIYDDTAQHIVLTKAAQIGGTTWAILKALHACTMGLNCLYLFPTKTDVIEFSKSRVGPLLRENRFLGRLVRDTDTAGLKRIGDSYLYLRGMQSTVGIKSIPVDMIVYDELDEATPDAKTLAKERLSHSDFKRIVELSNPSLPDYGIDEAYQLSDQRHWTLRCDRCGKWTALDKEFPNKLGQEVRIIRQREDGECYRACPKCDAELDMAEGEWVADFPDRKTHGYLISQLFSPKVDAGEILQDYRRTRFPERFYNLKIGIAWADTQNRITVAEVLKSCGAEGMLESSDESCTMGVDTGRELHVVIARRINQEEEMRRVVYLGAHQDYRELDDLMARFNISTCVIDALPEIHATRAFAQRHDGRVYMNYFNE
ncbi:MAG: phage terminase large subunit family protein, partial [Acidobacteria bacterium]|nr:phage terminase large subunit family protein [Acidobacteriota bacterium]